MRTFLGWGFVGVISVAVLACGGSNGDETGGGDGDGDGDSGDGDSGDGDSGDGDGMPSMGSGGMIDTPDPAQCAIDLALPPNTLMSELTETQIEALCIDMGVVLDCVYPTALLCKITGFLAGRNDLTDPEQSCLDAEATCLRDGVFSPGGFECEIEDLSACPYTIEQYEQCARDSVVGISTQPRHEWTCADPDAYFDYQLNEAPGNPESCEIFVECGAIRSE